MSIVLIFVPYYSFSYYLIYLACGLSDVLDGYFARKFQAISRFGTIMDTIADLTFYSIMILRFLQHYHLPWWIFVWIALLCVVRITAWLIRKIKWKQFLPMHSILNKFTAFCIFVIFLFPQYFRDSFAVGLCLVATASCLHELYMNLLKKDVIRA